MKTCIHFALRLNSSFNTRIKFILYLNHILCAKFLILHYLFCKKKSFFAFFLIKNLTKKIYYHYNHKEFFDSWFLSFKVKKTSEKNITLIRIYSIILKRLILSLFCCFSNKKATRKNTPFLKLHSTFFRWSTSIVRNRCYITNNCDS